MELVKDRSYDEEGGTATDSAKATLTIAVHTLLRLFAPYLPYATEEVWSWWQPGSVHRESWPTETEIPESARGDSSMLESVATVLAGIRGAKSTAKVKMRTPVSRLLITGPDMSLTAARGAENDLRSVGGVVGEIEYVTAAGDLQVEAVLDLG